MTTAGDWWRHLDGCAQCQYSYNTTHRGADLCERGRWLMSHAGTPDDPPWMAAERREVRATVEKYERLKDARRAHRPKTNE